VDEWERLGARDLVERVQRDGPGGRFGPESGKGIPLRVLEKPGGGGGLRRRDGDRGVRAKKNRGQGSISQKKGGARPCNE